jgi:hypothetical protein
VGGAGQQAEPADRPGGVSAAVAGRSLKSNSVMRLATAAVETSSDYC